MSTEDSTTIPEGYKRCSKCGEIKPATAEWFHRDGGRKDGLHVYCKVCVKQYHVINSKRLSAKAAEWNKSNPDKVKKHVRKYQLNHPDKVRERNKQWRKEHPDKVKKYNKTKYLKYGRERYNKWARAWRTANLEKARAIGRTKEHRRRARLRELPIETFNASLSIGYFNGYCPVCSKPLKDLLGEIKPNLDHWIPLSDSRLNNPGHVATNVIVLCNKCNFEKHSSDPLEWLQSKFGPRKAKQIQQRVEAYFQWVREQDNQSE